MSEPGQITELLSRVREGDRTAENQLLPLVYSELHRIATAYMRRERPNHTLQPTALVAEAYLQLMPQRTSWQNRAHFYGIAAQQMRRILLGYARKRKADKRGQGIKKLQFDDALVMAKAQPSEFVKLNDALCELEQAHPRQAKVVELKFFGGYLESEIAAMLTVSVETIKRDWRFAKAWLSSALRVK